MHERTPIVLNVYHILLVQIEALSTRAARRQPRPLHTIAFQYPFIAFGVHKKQETTQHDTAKVKKENQTALIFYRFLYCSLN
jgi:hypothetical protein